ncbi:MAG: sugar phosphate isomerase/epimerase [Bacteroidetes bacterium]|nr:sugar phosphate isomerase/epimerase [Bacteroidota bacterium]MBS1931853.1 sugar phosphate isomerase/epimerase [Bacteroidota bacterium]
MNYKRRDFLKLAGGLAITGLAGKEILSSFKNEEGNFKKFGLQLYTLRDDLKKGHPREILKLIAAAGYKQIESYEGPDGIFWGMSPFEFKSLVDELGMKAISSHCDINKNFEEKAEQASSIGMKYLICPSIDTQKSADEYKKFAEQFNKCGSICKKAGIRFAYHNHDHDFKIIDGQVVQDIYMENTDPALVDFEMDIYWVVTAQNDPVEWLKKYSNRFRLCHIKDRTKGATERDASCILGEGSIDYSKILKVAKENGMKYYIVEQELYNKTTPLKAMVADARYMKNLRF